MPNLYIWFETKEERRKFVGEMLGLEPLIFNGVRKGTKKFARMQQEASRCLDLIESSINPLYDLYRRYLYSQKYPEENPKLPPYHYDNIYAKGFRRIYYRKSYLYRPGNWLVIQLRKNESARKMYKWIMDRIPEERIGKNVPIPEHVLMKWKLEDVYIKLNRIFEFDYSDEDIKKIMSYVQRCLIELLAYDPKLFRGDNVYLWEKAAFIYNDLDDLDSMEFCLKTQAKLQPGKADAYLNLGSFYSARGLFREAVKAYMHGLMINPRDEYIYYNLASLLTDEDKGNYEIALGYINQAIQANPDRMINFKLKGDIYFYRMFYKEAIYEYQKAITMEDDPMLDMFYSECCCKLAKALSQIDRLQEALDILEEGLRKYSDDIDMLMELSDLLINRIKDFDKGAYYSEKVIKLDPNNIKAYKNLAKCYSKLEMKDKEIWVKKEIDKLKNRTLK